jgi:glutathione S-transferase
MSAPVRIIGSFLSPYVRKVLVVLAWKGIGYEIDPIVPFFGDDEFAKLSPLRRVPVLIDDHVTLADSSVICQYLEDRYPSPRIYPSDVFERARARWLEEFADTRMGDVFIWRLFNQVAINPFVWGRKTDPAIVERTLAGDIPNVLDYLERELPPDGFFFGEPSIADVSVACFFRNASFARFTPDATRWPRVAAFVARTLALDAFERLKPFEDRMMRTPIAKQREMLREMGAPICARTLATATPRRGPMRTD